MKPLFVVGLVLSLGLSGCDNSASVQAQAERDLPQMVTEELHKKDPVANASLTCNRVSLTHQNGNEYVGMAYYTNGKSAKINVTADGKNYFFETGPAS